MRLRTCTLIAAIAAALATTAIGAGAAAALTPVVVPQSGVYGVELDHGETQAFADGPGPALMDQYLPRAVVRIDVMPDSQLPRIGGHVFGSMRDIIGEAAHKPDGQVGFVVIPGPDLVIAQEW